MSALVPLDYGRPTPPPREIVKGWIRYSRVHLLTGHEGSGKSWLGLALSASVARGEPWVGMAVEQREKVLVIDQENPTPDVLERLYGLGLRGEDQPTLRYLSQQDVTLSDRESAAAVERVIDEFEPKLVFIDGAVSASGVDPIDNDGVTKLLMLLRTWANSYELAVVALAHVPKAADPDDPNAALGAGAWRHQVDAHIHSARAKPHHEEAQTENGGTSTTYRYRLRTSTKVRWGPRDESQLFVVRSERDPDGAMRWLRVEAEGGMEQCQQTGPSKPPAADRIMAALRAHGSLHRPELAAACEPDGMAHNGGYFKGSRAKGTGLAGLLGSGAVIELDDGRVALAGEGS